MSIYFFPSMGDEDVINEVASELTFEGLQVVVEDEDRRDLTT